MEVLAADRILVKQYKAANEYEIIQLMSPSSKASKTVEQVASSQNAVDEHKCCAVGDTVAVAYGNQWYPGNVTAAVSETHTVTVRFLKVAGKNRF
jgi:hypothetical protein